MKVDNDPFVASMENMVDVQFSPNSNKKRSFSGRRNDDWYNQTFPNKGDRF